MEIRVFVEIVSYQVSAFGGKNRQPAKAVNQLNVTNKCAVIYCLRKMHLCLRTTACAYITTLQYVADNVEFKIIFALLSCKQNSGWQCKRVARKPKLSNKAAQIQLQKTTTIEQTMQQQSAQYSDIYNFNLFAVIFFYN